MKTLLEITVVYSLAILFNSLISWLWDHEYTEAGSIRIMVIWYAIQWIEYRRSLSKIQDKSHDDQKCQR